MARITGIDFPFRKGGGQFPKIAENEVAIDASIRQIIEVGKGERVMRPSSGSLVWRFVFENNNALLKAKIQREVRRAIRDQEKRVKVVRVDVTRGDGPDGVGNLVRIDVVYKLSGRLARSTVNLDSRESG
jgi:phage baseplate assembly protein W